MSIEASERLAGLIEWLSGHPKHLGRLCADPGDIGHEGLLETLEALEDREYYELALLLILRHDIDRAVSYALTRCRGASVAAELRKNGIKQTGRRFRSILREEIDRCAASGRAGA